MNSRRYVNVVSVAIGLLLAALPAPAALASSNDLIKDCSEDGIINNKYSPGDYQRALDHLPADLDEYTDCRAAIRRAQLAAGGKRRKGILGLVDTATPPTGSELQRIERAQKSAGSLDVGGRVIKPGQSGAPFLAAGLGTDLPGLVLASLVVLTATLFWGAVFAFRRRWPAAWAATGGRLTGSVRDTIKRGITRWRS